MRISSVILFFAVLLSIFIAYIVEQHKETILFNSKKVRFKEVNSSHYERYNLIFLF